MSGISQNSLGIILQRGGEELILEKVEDKFTARPRDGISSVERSLQNLFDSKEHQTIAPANLELFAVSSQNLESAMSNARTHEAIAFASHVYKLKDNPGTFVYLGDQITVEFLEQQGDARINSIATQFGLLRHKQVAGLANTFVFLTSQQATENPIKIANRLMGLDEVLVAEPNVFVHTQPYYKPRDPLYSRQWYLAHNGGNFLATGSDIAVEKAWDITRGNRSTVVAVVDDSFDLNHPDFQGKGKIVAPKDFKERDFLPSPGEKDAASHGTACAGIALAEENGEGIVGVAPGCSLMPIRSTGYLDDESIENIFDWAVAKGASVISCSWGASAVYFPLSLRQRAAITRAATDGRNGKGCVILFAAGNANRPINGNVYERGWIKNIVRGNTKWLSGFAAHTDAIAVSASTSLKKKAAYSNWGNHISICAPSNNANPGVWFQETGFIYTQPGISEPLHGRGMLTTDQLGDPGYSDDDYTNNFGGTSSATPVVAGVVGLVLSANPDLTAKQVKRLLEETADKIVDLDPDPQLGLNLGSYNENGHSQWFGYGKVNAAKAVQAAHKLRIASVGVTRDIEGYNHNRIAIPDNDPRGIKSAIAIGRSSPIAMSAPNLVKDIQVSVDITHQFLGDLEIYLIAPNNFRILLQSRTLGRSTSLQKTYTTRSHPVLNKLFSIQVNGTWQLLIIDLSPQDIGTLNKWELSLSF
ncbi:MAG: S8 family serine peptidase [Cyanobacteria bacterium P01_A01_bin.84]